MADRFFDFDLCIWKEGDLYKAEVRHSPAGTCDRKGFDWPFREDHQNLLRDLELAVMRAQGYRGALMSADEAKLRDFGSSVFKAVFRGAPEIEQLYNASLALAEHDRRGLRLKLRVDPPELAMLPWEYVYDNVRSRDFVCLDENQPLVRFFFVEGRAVAPQPDDRPLRVLAMVANPKGDLDVEKERRRIDQAFEKVPADQHELRWVQGETRDALFEALKEGPWDIFHFIGHGGVDSVEDEKGQLHTVGYLLVQDRKDEDPRFYASGLAAMLKMGKVRLAVLNCCDSGRGPISGLGATLVQTTVPLAVAMQFPISDEAALEFSEEFYKALVRGQSVENALTLARTVMYAKSRLEWGIPVLFTRSEPTVMLRAGPRALGTKPVAPLGPVAPVAPVAAVVAAAAPVSPITVTAPVSAPAAPAAIVTAAAAPPLTDAQREFRRLWSQA